MVFRVGASLGISLYCTNSTGVQMQTARKSTGAPQIQRFGTGISMKSTPNQGNRGASDLIAYEGKYTVSNFISVIFV